MKNILSMADLTKDEILNIIHKAQDLKEQGISSIDRKATVANLFFENSTRTKCSFERAERKLGLDILPQILHLFRRVKRYMTRVKLSNL